MIIVEYIDGVWNDRSPLLPSDPYQRAQARFWADYIDSKVYSAGRRVCCMKGEEREAAKKELVEILKVLESQLGEKPYFGGESLGFVDVALVPFSCWFHTYETLGEFNIEEQCPTLIAWVKRCLEKESVSKSLEPPEKIYDFAVALKKRLGID